LIQDLIEPAAGAAIVEGVRAEVFTGPESIARLAPEWEGLFDSANTDLYSSPVWCETWWKHYGRGRLRVMTFRVGGLLVGVLPMFVERVWAWPLRTTVARLIGADSTISVIKPAVIAEHAAGVYAAALTVLFGDEGCDCVWFGPLSGHRTHAGHIKDAASASNARLIHDRPMSPHAEFEPPATFEGYLSSLEKRQRQNLRRDLNQLAAKHSFKTDVVAAPADVGEAFDQFLQMHARQWQAQDQLGHFSDWPGSEAFTRDLIDVLSRRDAVRLIRLHIDGNLAAYELCLRCGEVYHWRLPARESGAHWDKLGLGRVGMAKMIEAAVADGATRIEAGPGHYDYKVKHGAVEYDLRSILVSRGGSFSQMRARLLVMWARVLHLAYYRVWYRHLRARLGLRGRPLWRAWIRRRM